MTIIALVAALTIGLTLGVLGAGGSILSVPALVFALHVEPKLAIVMALPIVGGASLAGAVRHWIRRDVDVRVALLVGLVSMTGAYAGARVARNVDGDVQLVLLTVAMLAASVMMFRDAAASAPSAEAPRITAGLLGMGAAAGVLTGLIGIGGGFILVPVLVLFARLSMRAATGTSLTVIVMNTATAYAGYHGVVQVPWRLVLFFGGTVAAGVLIGGAFADRLPDRRLKQAFAVLLVLVALSLGWRVLTS